MHGVHFGRVCYHLELLHIFPEYGFNMPFVEGSLGDFAKVLLRVLEG